MQNGQTLIGYIDVVDLVFTLAPDCPGYIYSPINVVDTFYSIIGDRSNSLYLFKKISCNPSWPNIDWVDWCSQSCVPPSTRLPRIHKQPWRWVDTFWSIICDHSNSLYLLKNLLPRPNWPNIDGEYWSVQSGVPPSTRLPWAHPQP